VELDVGTKPDGNEFNSLFGSWQTRPRAVFKRTFFRG